MPRGGAGRRGPGRWNGWARGTSWSSAPRSTWPTGSRCRCSWPPAATTSAHRSRTASAWRARWRTPGCRWRPCTTRPKGTASTAPSTGASTTAGCWPSCRATWAGRPPAEQVAGACCAPACPAVNPRRLSPARGVRLLLLLLLGQRAEQVLGRMHQEHVVRGQVDHVLVLAPEERPVLLVLREVRLEHQHARHHAAGDEAEVGPVHAVGHLLGAGADG